MLHPLAIHLILAVGLYQVAKFHVGVAIAGIAVRLFRLWRHTLFVDYLPRTMRTDGGTDTASNTCIRRKDNLLGTCDRRPLTIPAGVAVIAFADHTVLLSDRLNIVLTTVNGRENGGNPLWNTLILRVSLFLFCIKIRQVCIDHLNGGNIVHLHPVLLCKLVNKLRKDGTMRTKSADGEEIIGLESGTGDKVLDDCRQYEAIDRADKTYFFRFIDGILIVDFL